MERRVGYGGLTVRPTEPHAADAARPEVEAPRSKVRFADEDSFMPIPKKRMGREKVNPRTPADVEQEREFDSATPSMAEAKRRSARVQRPLLGEVQVRIDMLRDFAASEPESEKEVTRREKTLDKADQLEDALNQEILRLENERDYAKLVDPEDIQIASYVAQISEVKRLMADLIQSKEPIETQTEDFWSKKRTP